MVDYGTMNDRHVLAVAVARAMLIATTAVVHDRLTDEELDRRRALLAGPKPCDEGR